MDYPRLVAAILGCFVVEPRPGLRWTTEPGSRRRTAGSFVIEMSGAGAAALDSADRRELDVALAEIEHLFIK